MSSSSSCSTRCRSCKPSSKPPRGEIKAALIVEIAWSTTPCPSLPSEGHGIFMLYLLIFRPSISCIKEWRNFTTAIMRAKEACKQSGHTTSDHFVEANKMVKLGSGSQRKIEDYRLSRYACYLIVQNADPDKPIVALGQTYFAVQTRRQELADELALSTLPEDLPTPEKS